MNELHFVPLTPDLTADFLAYFDHIGFTDNPDFSMCYCLESQLTPEEDEALDTREKRAARAAELIGQGRLCGYLVYVGAQLAGWLNTADKLCYPPLQGETFRTVPLRPGQVQALFCMEIAPAWRGKGIAHRMVDFVCQQASADGFTWVEAYPFADAQFPYQYHGPERLYRHHGFQQDREADGFRIMRKEIKPV